MAHGLAWARREGGASWLLGWQQKGDVMIYYTIYPPLFPLFYRLTRLLRADFDTNVPLFGVAFVLMICARTCAFRSFS